MCGDCNRASLGVPADPYRIIVPEREKYTLSRSKANKSNAFSLQKRFFWCFLERMVHERMNFPFGINAACRKRNYRW